MKDKLIEKPECKCNKGKPTERDLEEKFHIDDTPENVMRAVVRPLKPPKKEAENE